MTTLVSGYVGLSTGIATDGTNLYWLSFFGPIFKVVLATGEVTKLADVPAGARGLTTDGMNLYVTYCHGVSKVVIATGGVEILAGGEPGYADGSGSLAKFYYPSGITKSGDSLYVNDYSNYVIRRIN